MYSLYMGNIALRSESVPRSVDKRSHCWHYQHNTVGRHTECLHRVGVVLWITSRSSRSISFFILRRQLITMSLRSTSSPSSTRSPTLCAALRRWCAGIIRRSAFWCPASFSPLWRRRSRSIIWTSILSRRSANGTRSIITAIRIIARIFSFWLSPFGFCCFLVL